MYRTIYSPQGARIELDGASVVNMASNNYLGLANHPALKKAALNAIEKYGVGAAAARNIVGNYPLHTELEEKLAKYKGVEATLVFNSGVAANTGLIPVLAGKGDVILSDELNHGSIIDGCRLSRAETKVFKHMDMQSLEERLKEPCEGRKFIITDGVFSMDGDLPPLSQIADLADKYNAYLVVDDAHGDGVMGSYGKGTVDYFGLHGRVFAESGSLGKAFGVAGGFIAGSKELIDEVRAKGRSFIFTASPLAPNLTAALIAAIDMLSEDDTLVKKLWDNRAYFMQRMDALGIDTGNTQTPIIPIMLGNEERAKEVSAKLYEEGVYAQAVIFPLVPKGKARLRVIITADHTKEDLDFAANAIEKVVKGNF